MKVVDIKPFSEPVIGKVLGQPIFRDAINQGGELVQWTFTEIHTDEGITGITPFNIGREMIEILKPAVIGEDPTNIQRIWDKMYWRCFNQGRKGAAVIAMSAIDVGLWDIIGKKQKMPVYKLLGGYRDRVPGYGSGGVLSLSKDELIREQMSYLEDGYKAVKMKVGLRDPRQDIERVKAVREAIGNGIDLMVDANNGWSTSTAIQMAKRLERFDVRWLEEPVTAEDYDGYSRVAASTEIPVAGGESEYTKYGFKQLFTRGCLDIVQADVGKVGGITEYMKIDGMAEAFGLPMCPHELYYFHFFALLRVLVSAARARAFLLQFTGTPIHHEYPYAQFLQRIFRLSRESDIGLRYTQRIVFILTGARFRTNRKILI